MYEVTVTNNINNPFGNQLRFKFDNISDALDFIKSILITNSDYCCFIMKEGESDE